MGAPLLAVSDWLTWNGVTSSTPMCVIVALSLVSAGIRIAAPAPSAGQAKYVGLV